MPTVEIDASARAGLAAYGWPGNVRELRNLIERSLILGGFPDDFRRAPASAGPAGGETLEEIEKRHILSVLRETDGSRDEAARRLGVSRKTIDRKCVLWNV